MYSALRPKQIFFFEMAAYVRFFYRSNITSGKADAVMYVKGWYFTEMGRVPVLFGFNILNIEIQFFIHRKDFSFIFILFIKHSCFEILQCMYT